MAPTEAQPPPLGADALGTDTLAADTAPPHLPVLYRDDEILVVNKPSGLLVHPGWAREPHTALSLARAIAGSWVYPVHRLDRATSGVLVFALSPDGARRVGSQFAEGSVRKRYRAAVRGVPADGLVDHPLPRGEDRQGPRVPARTVLSCLSSITLPGESPYPIRYSWVEARPETGRLHQIRRHLKHLGHPLLGDVRYGKGDHNRLCRARFGLSRLALHACSLELQPLEPGAEPLCFHAVLPEDLRVPLLAMGFPEPLLADA